MLLGQILGAIGGILMLVCHIIIIVKMFQRGQTGLGILAIVLSLCVCLPGFLFTFIYGWVRSTEWNLKNVMIAYTVGLVLDIIGNVLAPPDISAIQRQLQGQQHAP